MPLPGRAQQSRRTYQRKPIFPQRQDRKPTHEKSRSIQERLGILAPVGWNGRPGWCSSAITQPVRRRPREGRRYRRTWPLPSRIQQVELHPSLIFEGDWEVVIGAESAPGFVQGFESAENKCLRSAPGPGGALGRGAWRSGCLHEESSERTLNPSGSVEQGGSSPLRYILGS